MHPMDRLKCAFIACFITIATLATTASYASDPLEKLLPNEHNTIVIFKKTSPFVVNVHNLKTVLGPAFDVFDVQAGVSSGFIWDKQGHVITNYHVIRGASKVAITFEKGKTIKAKVVGVEPRKDIAVLKLASTKPLKKLESLPTVPIADSSKLLVGQKTVAIGNPFGLDRTLTTGVISALGRQIRGVGGVKIHDMIQTDASINPGNSGGPLLNSQGEFIGMNTMIYSRSGASAGIGFAVPSNTIKQVVDQIIRYGRVIQPGIGFSPLSNQIARQLGIKGVIIGSIVPGSPAAQASLKGTVRDRNGRIHLGDIIVAIDSQPIKNYDDLYNILEKKQIGQTITLTYLRNGKAKTIKLRTIELYSNP